MFYLQYVRHKCFTPVSGELMTLYAKTSIQGIKTEEEGNTFSLNESIFTHILYLHRHAHTVIVCP